VLNLLLIMETDKIIEIAKILERVLEKEIEELSYFGSGQTSRVYKFRVGLGFFVIKTNNLTCEVYKRELFIQNNFTKINKYLPKILQNGKSDNVFFSITEIAKGTTLKEIPDNEVVSFFDKVFEVLEEIHSSNIPDSSCYGKIDSLGIAKHKTWRDVLLDKTIYSANPENNKKINTDLWNRCYEKIKFLSKFILEEKKVVHGDFSKGNLFFFDGEITNIIDWEETMYGDNIYDVARISFWSSEVDFADLYHKKYIEKYNHEITNFKERVLCYKIRIKLKSLSWYCHSEQTDKYNKTQKELEKIMEEI
jgi:aminoglycoside phosphotransferase (APT) family kinase protein